VTQTLAAILAKPFEKPTTKDFVFDYWFKTKIFGIEFGINFVIALFLLVLVVFFTLFIVAFRKPTIVPGKFQALMEMGIEFVRNQIMLQMIGPEGLPFLPFLATLFFFIFIGNIFEVIPFVGFPLNSRIAFPMVMAIVTWVVYNAVGIKHHGFGGYLKIVMFPPGVPGPLKPFLALIEFISVILVRPLTLSVRLFANMVAGHFLLSVFFLGTLVLITALPLGPLFGVMSFGLGTLLIGFEIFVAALQAFIFSVLTASYIGGAMASEH
jgi:F-type H+-transporting ATPase subunit a